MIQESGTYGGISGRIAGGVLGALLLGLLAIDPALAQNGSVSTGSGQGLGALWSNYQAFVAVVVLFFTFLGALSKSLALAAWSGYVAFVYLALNSGNEMFRGIALVTLVLTFLGMAFKLVRLELDADR